MNAEHLTELGTMYIKSAGQCCTRNTESKAQFDPIFYPQNTFVIKILTFPSF